jgi:hypothetical protein
MQSERNSRSERTEQLSDDRSLHDKIMFEPHSCATCPTKPSLCSTNAAAPLQAAEEWAREKTASFDRGSSSVRKGRLASNRARRLCCTIVGDIF